MKRTGYLAVTPMLLFSALFAAQEPGHEKELWSLSSTSLRTHRNILAVDGKPKYRRRLSTSSGVLQHRNAQLSPIQTVTMARRLKITSIKSYRGNPTRLSKS
jgi:hypothetical protein